MAIQIEQFDLCNLEPNINIKITGKSRNGESFLKGNIIHILDVKKHNTMQNNYTNGKLETYCIMLTDRGYDSKYDLLFINLNYERLKKEVKDKYKFTNEDGVIEPYTFIVFQDKQIKYLCNVENKLTYLKTFNKNPFCYNNIIKLVDKITNNYSMFHTINSDLYENLQIRLKELDIIYFTIFCVKNMNIFNIWLPYELRLEIINLFGLSCLQ